MGKQADTNQFTKGIIAVLKEEGYSQRQIAAKLKISKTAVHHKNTDRTTKRKNCGRKRTKRGDRLLKLLNQRSPEASSTSIAQQVRQLGVNISSRTVRRRLE